MKLAIVILFAIIVATEALRIPTSAEQSLAADYRAECRLKLGITLAEGVALREGHFATASQKQKCYLVCLATIFGYLDENGVYNEKKDKDDLTPLIGRKRAQQVIKDCRNVTGTDNCDLITNVYACRDSYHTVFSL